jgi:hypothetical protein
MAWPTALNRQLLSAAITRRTTHPLPSASGTQEALGRSLAAGPRGSKARGAQGQEGGVG